MSIVTGSPIAGTAGQAGFALERRLDQAIDLVILGALADNGSFLQRADRTGGVGQLVVGVGGVFLCWCIPCMRMQTPFARYLRIRLMTVRRTRIPPGSPFVIEGLCGFWQIMPCLTGKTQSSGAASRRLAAKKNCDPDPGLD